MAMFHALEIIARGPRILIKVDGMTVTDYTDARTTYKKGRIALKVDGPGIVVFKTIEIKELPPPASVDHGIAFDGNGSRVEIPSLFTDGKRPLTVEGYCRPRRFSPQGECILMMNGPGAVFLNIGGRPPYLTSGAYLGEQAWGRHIPLRELGDMSRRFHFALVWDGMEYRLYVDGRRCGTAYATNQGPGKKNGTVLGAGPDDKGNRRFQGVLDEIRISSRARYEADFTPQKRFAPDEHTIALYHCDEGQGDVLVDSSGNGHHGKIVGAKWLQSPR
jgi:hypothetical protein